MHTRGANDAQEKVAGNEFVAYIPLLDDKYFTTILIDRIMHSFLGGLAIVFSDPWAPK